VQPCDGWCDQDHPGCWTVRCPSGGCPPLGAEAQQPPHDVAPLGLGGRANLDLGLASTGTLEDSQPLDEDGRTGAQLLPGHPGPRGAQRRTIRRYQVSDPQVAMLMFIGSVRDPHGGVAVFGSPDCKQIAGRAGAQNRLHASAHRGTRPAAEPEPTLSPDRSIFCPSPPLDDREAHDLGLVTQCRHLGMPRAS